MLCSPRRNLVYNRSHRYRGDGRTGGEIQSMHSQTHIVTSDTEGKCPKNSVDRGSRSQREAAKLGSLEVPCSRSAGVASQVQTVQTISPRTLWITKWGMAALTARRVPGWRRSHPICEPEALATTVVPQASASSTFRCRARIPATWPGDGLRRSTTARQQG